ncbi:hypothetical protein LRAMOSA00913 [Lichtheimia ramosa]|uniref:Uncharacterized protein n=1 Tax=Lichtheimia ramosa TaxID=688394 RepID=A0A077W8Z8_9FUNG|nr:hypothetical protein LRAMOSA00913 [Lichtheimia ramosa]
MSPFTALREADKAAQDALSLVKTIDTIYKRLEACSEKISVPSDYPDPNTVRNSIFSENINDLDWVEPAVDRLNVAMFTKDVWSNNVQYDEAIANFFQLLIPRELHDQDDIVDLFIDIVTRWAVDETRWPIAMHTTKDVVNDKVRERIESDLKDEDPLLYQRILDAFGARFEQLDLTRVDVSIINANKEMKEAWFRVLPMILKAIDSKVVYQFPPKRQRVDSPTPPPSMDDMQQKQQ